jgi:hypothetical protein
MSAQPLLQSTSSWNPDLRLGSASFEKIPPKGLLLARDLKISLILIDIIDQMLVVRVTAPCRDTYLKIVGAAQKKFADKSKYHFESSFQHFPKDGNGLCTVEAVKAALFSNTYQTGVIYPLVYSAPAEDISKQLGLIIKSLQEADSKVEEITPHIQAFLKSRNLP